MTNKTIAAYVALFEYINANIINLNPATFMLDFELASRKAIERVYPTCKVSGCYFHFTQAVRKKASKIPNFFNIVNKDKEMNRLYHKFQSIPLLPEAEIPIGFQTIKAESMKYPIFKEFVMYYEIQWILKVI